MLTLSINWKVLVNVLIDSLSELTQNDSLNESLDIFQNEEIVLTTKISNLGEKFALAKIIDLGDWR